MTETCFCSVYWHTVLFVGFVNGWTAWTAEASTDNCRSFPDGSLSLSNGQSTAISVVPYGSSEDVKLDSGTNLDLSKYWSNKNFN
jgi:hypothetical protein